ncbi:E3 ubiquitin-protein ligase TRIM11-like [Salminus brasiliensis]|uniref:E3 ubiquitin-protein ligase TRIM11-like n=1 Tax=Salminus brasiliensis TaxID=930266 RepID=UPI003B837288
MSAVAEDLEAELSCAVCLDVYKDPRLLTCGHNFCHACLLRLWENQGADLQSYSCPECRTTFEHYPATQRNIKLSNIIGHLQANREARDSGAGAVQLQHPEDAEHVPTPAAVCADHGRPWEFFCKEHKSCLCRSCLEEHQSHPYLLLQDAKAVSMAILKGHIRTLEKSRTQTQGSVEWLRCASSRLASDRAKLREQLVQLFDEIQDALAAEREAVFALVDLEEERSLTLLKSRLGEAEEKQGELAWLITEANGLVEQEIPAKDFMDRSDWVMERMLKVDVLQAPPCRVERHELDRPAVGQLQRDGQAAVRNVSKGIREKLRLGKSKLMESPPVPPKPLRSITLKPPTPELTDLILDPNTAHCNISISDDRSSARWVARPLARPPHPERFRLHPQVLCSQGLSEGEHVWQVEVGGTRRWEVGVTCKSRDQAWVDSCISWALRWDGRQLQAFEGHKRYSNPKLGTLKRAPELIQVHLHCGLKTLSFCTSEDGLLHSFSIKPSGPVFPGFYLEESFVKIKKQDNIHQIFP